MWTCKKCGNKLSDEWQECWKCNTGRDWVPPSDWVTPPDAPVFPFEQQTTGAANSAPLSRDLASALGALGIAVGIVGVIAGAVVLFNSPEAPSAYSTNPLTEIARANRMVYLVLGWSQIVGGLVTGLLLYVVGGIGQIVVDLWEAQNVSERNQQT